MSDLLTWLLLGCAMLLILAAAAWLDAWATDHLPTYTRMWERAFGEFQPERSHVQLVPAPSTSPTPMRCCGAIGWHANGCGLLDAMDAGERR